MRLVPPLLLLDDSLYPADLFHRGVVLLTAALQVLRLEFQKTGVIPLVVPDAAVLKLDSPPGDLVQEVTVVGNDNICAAIVVQESLQPLNGLNIQMVGWLVQQQQIRIGKQQLRQLELGLLTAAEHRNRQLQVAF